MSNKHSTKTNNNGIMGIQLNISTVTIYRNKSLLDQVMFIRRISFMQADVSGKWRGGLKIGMISAAILLSSKLY